jgi:hypothetical protein
MQIRQDFEMEKMAQDLTDWDLLPPYVPLGGRRIADDVCKFNIYTQKHQPTKNKQSRQSKYPITNNPDRQETKTMNADGKKKMTINATLTLIHMKKKGSPLF